MKNTKHIRLRFRFLFILFVCILGQGNGVFGQCTLTVQDVNYCNTSGAVLGIGMQLTLGPAPITSAITSYSWTGPNGFTSNLQYPVLPAPVAPGNYTLTVEAPGCVTDASDNTINVSTTSNNCPTAAFTSSPAVVCDGATTTFTNQSGNGNTYFWLFGDGSTSTSASPTHVYNVPEGTGTVSFTATLVVTNATGRMDIEQRVITVRQIPAEPNIMSDQLLMYNGEEYLVACTPPEPTGDIFLMGISNPPSGSWAINYIIDWGDGQPTETYSTFPAFLAHNYALGLYTLSINIIGPNNCSVSNTYKVFVGNTPAVFLGIPGNTEQCTPYTFNFPISNVSNNVEGTTYLVTFSDGGAPQTFSHPPPAFVSHTFTESSCGEISPIFSYPDAFSVKITAQNPCSQNFAVVEPIRISTPPIANFTALPTPVCINNPVTVNSTADPGTNVNAAGCNTNHGMVWSISPAAGWTLTSGTLGSTNGQPNNYTNWTTGSNQLSLTFSAPGNYTITQRIRNSCGEDVETRTVCVVPPVTAAFNLDFTDQCAPEIITTDNLTFPLNTCVPPIYLWTITPPAPFAVNVPPFTPASFEPAWLLTNNGTYTITLTATNACGFSVDDTIFTIVAPPTVNLLPIPPGCAPYIVDPSVTYTNGGGSIILQEWKIDNGPWTAVLPNEPVDYPPLTFGAGSHTIQVRITNQCGTVTSTQIFVVTSPPQINLLPFSVCSDVPELINGIVPPIVIGSGAPPYIYNWTGAGISPTIVSNPSIVLTNTNIPPLATISPISLIVTDVLGCADTANVNVMVNPLPTLTATPNAKCIGAPAVPLTVSSNISGTTFAWSPSGSLNPSTGAIVQANPNTSTTYTITGTVTSTGCVSTTTTDLTVNPLPVVDAGPIIVFCAQAIQTQILQGTPAGGTWSDPTPLSGSFLAPNFYTPQTTPGSDVLVYSYTDANGCTNTGNGTVSILTTDPADAGTSFNLCNNEPPVVLAPGNPTGGIWSGAGVTTQGANYVFNPANVSPGTYTLNYTINTGTTCETSDPITVIVHPIPIVNAGLDKQICSGLPINISAQVSSGTLPYAYTWTPTFGITGATNTNQITVSILNNGATDVVYPFNISVTDANNCTVEDDVNLTVHPLPVVEAGPNQTLCSQVIPFTLSGFSPTTNGVGVWSGSTQLVGNIYTPSTTPVSEMIKYTFTDLNGCINKDSLLITTLPAIIPNAGVDTALCLNVGLVTINSVNNSGGIWTGNGINASGVFNPQIAGVGTHVLTYTINSGTTCQTSDTRSITVYPIPSVNAGLDKQICSGLPVNFTAQVNAGTLPYAYTWTPVFGIIGASNTNQINVSIQNNGSVDVVYPFNISVTDANNCIVADDVNLTVHPLPLVEAGPNQILCSQVIPFTLSGYSPTTNGVGVWSGSTQLVGNIYTPTITPVSEMIKYTFTDLNGCMNKDSLLITTLAPAFPNAGIDTALCLNVGLVTINSVDNPGGIWSGTGINASGVFNPLTAAVGTFVLTYTINSGTTCQTSDARSITVHPIPTVNAGLDRQICSGLPVNFTALVNSGTQPYTYSWTPISGIIGATNINQITISILNNGNTDVVYPFNISVSDANNCIASDNVNLTVHPLPVVEAGPNQTLCSQVIPFTLSGFIPTTNGVGIWSGSTQLVGNIYTPTTTPLLDTITYTFTDLNSCVNKDSLIITTLAPVFPNAGIDTALCLNVGLVTLNSVDNPGGIWSGTGINASGVFNPLTAGIGTHVLTYTINAGTTCQTSDTRSITVYPIPTVNAGLNQTICSGDTITFTATVSGGLSPYTYSWNPTTSIIGSNASNPISVSETNQGPGISNSILSVEVTDNNQCVVSDVVQLNIRPNPIVNAGPDTTLCFSVTVPYLLNGYSPAGGTWLNFPSNSGTLTGLNFQTGGIGLDTLSYSYTDGFGCSSKDSILINVTSPLTVDAGPDLRFCEDDATITLSMPLPANPPASYTAAWTGPGITQAAGVFSFNPALAGPGNHTINYTFEFGATCAATDAVAFYVGAIPEIVAADFGICDLINQNLNVTIANGTGTAPFIYQWLPNAGLSNTTILSPTFTADNVSGTDETVALQLTVSDDVGCSAISTIDVTVLPLPVVNAGLDSTLCNQPIPYTLSGYSPTTGGTGVWTGSANLVGNIYTPTGLASGLGNQTLTYTFTDIYGCVNSDQVVITTVVPIFPNAGVNKKFCFTDASEALVPTTQPGGIWSGPGVSLLSGNYEFDPSAAGVGTHLIVYTIFDGTTCETYDTLIYKVFPMPGVNAGIDQQMCSGETIAITGVGTLGTLPYQYAWTPITGILSGSLTSTASIQLFNNNTADVTQSYTLTLTDSAGCIASDIIEITVHPLPIVDAGSNFTLCNQPIAYTLSGFSPTTGGTGVWTGSANLSGNVYTPTGLANGLGNQTLTYTFTDIYGCVSSDQLVITTVTPVFPNAGVNKKFCIADASAALVPTTQPGGIWSGPGVSILAGNYEFDPSVAGVGTHAIVYTIFDGTTCETYDTLIYKVFPTPIVNAGNDQQMCSGNTIQINGIGSLGTLPYQFAWTPTAGILLGSSTATASVQLFNNTASDIIQSYTLTLTDSAGCIASDITDITVHPLPVVNAGLDSILCNQPIAYPLSGYSPTTGGTGVWTDSANLVGNIYTPTGLANGLGNQTLTYTFTDFNACVNSDQVLLTVVTPVFPNAGLDIETCISDVPLTLIPTTLPGGIWSGAGISQQGSDYLFSPSNAGDGVFTIYYTVYSGNTCETKDSIEVTVYPLPEVTLGPDIDLCVDAACYQVTDFLPNNGNWVLPPTGLFYGEGSVSNTGLFCPQLNTPGDYKIYYQYTNPITTCVNLDSMIIRLHPLPIPQFTLDSVICINTGFNPINTSVGDTIYGGGVVYQWRVLDYLQVEYASYSGNSPNITIADTGNFIIELTMTTSTGCVNQFQRSVFIIDIPVPTFSLSAYTGCAPLSIDITNLSSGNYPEYNWTVNGVYQDLTASPQAITFPSPILGDTTYIVRLNISNQCGASDYQEEFLARPTPVSSISADTYVGCSPFVPVFTNSSYGSPDAYTWIFSDGFIYNDSLPVGHGLIAIDNDTTNYTVILVTQNACGVDSATLNFVALPNTIVAFFNTLPQFGCAPLPVTLTNFSSGATNYLWNFDDGSAEVSTYNASHVFQEGGNYTVSLIATDGCSIDTAYSTIVVYPRPTIDFIPDEDVICQGNLLRLTNLSQGAVAYLWDFGNNETSTSFEPNYAYDTAGSFIVQLIGYSPVFGCPDTFALPIEVINTPQINIDVDPMMGCMPLLVNFTNNTLFTSGMEWDFGNGLTSTSFNPSTNYYQFGEYLVDITAHNYSFAYNLDCPIDTQIVISVFPKPTSSFTMESNASCGDSVTVAVENISTGASSYLWSWQSSNSFEFEPLISVTDTGYFPIQLIVSNQFACTDTTSRMYRLTGQPLPQFIADPVIGCMPLSSNFSSLTPYGDRWEWDFGDGTTSNQGPNTQHEYVSSGNYTVSLLVGNDDRCFADTTINQMVIVLPRANAALSLNTPIITTNYPLVLFENQSSNATEFDLYPGDGSHYTDFVNQHIYQIEDQSSFDILLIANNQYNCPDTAYSVLKVEPSSDVFIPNSFTPNGDGRNELFGPVFDGELTYFNFLIFDRWGHIIFETFDVNEKWNGTFKNQNKEPIKQDVYVYKIVFAFGGSFDSYYNRVGNVTVIY